MHLNIFQIEIFSKLDIISFSKKGYVIEKCRNCKREIEAKKRQCPYCGILNPTVKLKDIFVGIAIVLVIMSVVTFFMN